MQLIQHRAELESQIHAFKAAKETIALVPTMGNLHEGHLALVKRAKAAADRVVVTIFVNPTQFAEHEDFDDYPRTLNDDMAALYALAPDIVYAPAADEIYHGKPSAIQFRHPVVYGLESATRPQFFDGVTTVVRELFAQTLPNVAVFGEKDYQQLCAIRAMVEEEQLGIEILGEPTIREHDGLAMSSRNRFLEGAERKLAPMFHARLTEVAKRFANGERPETVKSWAFEVLLEDGFDTVDYVAIRTDDTLDHITAPTAPARVLGAVRVNTKRLIDNVVVPARLN